VSGRGRLVAYVGSTAIAGLVAFVWALPQVDPRAALLVMAAVFVAELTASTFRDEVTASLTNVIVPVAMIVGGTPLAIVAALGAVPAFALRASDMRVLRTVFNGGQYVLAAAAGGLVYETLLQLSGSEFPHWVSLIAVLAAAIVHNVVNHASVAGIVAILLKDDFLATFRSIGPSIALQVPYAGIAILAALLVESLSVWALLFMAVPAFVARYGLLAFQRLDESYERLVLTFVKAIEIKDLYTRGHSERVAELSVHVAEELGIRYEERRLTRYAALLHDVGKIGVPLCVINKPGPLDDDEFAQIKKHPTIGAEILRDIDFLGEAIDIVRYHHERLDGRGYPHGVGEDELSDIVRIVTVVDAFDAMTSTRSYRKALTVEQALAELHRCAGRQFDPRMVAALERYVAREGWEPTIEFASEAELHGHAIPLGTAQERIGDRPSSEVQR
jgi:putative nucleotidyltransferase with HDIG domain